MGRNDIYPGATFLHDYELSRFTDGFAAITIGRADGSGTITQQGNVIFNDPVTLRSPLGNGNIILNNSIFATSSLTLEAAKDIISNNGASINAPDGTTTIATLNGDVVLGNYTGVSLKIESPGSITAKDIKITAPDTSLSGSNSDIDILKSSPALILRAGLSNLGEPTSSGKINVGSIDTTHSFPIPVGVPVSGSVILSAFGDVTTGSINTTSDFRGTGDSALNNSGSIFITSTAGTIDTSAGFLTTGARFAAQAGSIVLDAKKDITTGDIFSGRNGTSLGGELKLISREGSIDTTAGSIISSRGDFFSSGQITFNAAGDIKTNAIDSSGGSHGGAINLDAGGNIAICEVSSYTCDLNEKYDGGAVAIKAQGNIITESITTFGRIGGAVNLDASGNIITADINTRGVISGAVNFDAGGNITTDDILTFSFGLGSDTSMIAKSGAIALTAGGDISTKDLSSYFISTGDGGAITLTADGNISTKDLFSFSYSQSGNAGNGGAIANQSSPSFTHPRFLSKISKNTR